jgi:hypothetical protein
MANGRFLSKTIAVSVQLASVSDQAENLFFRMLPHLDRDGRIEGEPRLVKAIVAPLRESLTVERITTLLHELVQAKDSEDQPLIQWYTAKGKMVIQCPGFTRHQTGLRKDREAPSRLPRLDQSAVMVPPPPQVRSDAGVDPDLLQDERGGHDGVGPASTAQKLREVEVKSKGSADADADTDETKFQAGPYITDWREIRQGIPPNGQIAKFAKQVESEVGPDEARSRWRRFLRSRQHSPPAYFAQEHGQYATPDEPEIRYIDEEREALNGRH